MRLTRYMSFPRFVSSLKDGLFIPSPLLLDDRWEGLMPFHKLAPAELVLDRKDYRQFVQWMYVSCWHGQAHESFAMWKIYGQIREAILMQTTSDKLKDAFDRQYPNVLAYFDQVDYKDPAQAEQIAFPKIQRLSTRPADVPGGEWFPYMVFMYIKHITYQYEHEVRLVSLDAGYVNGGSNSKKVLR
jgi:hypothetical protein